jgi:hypothetical protein
MGTRALTFVYDGTEPILSMYRTFDGYPTGHGAELSVFLNSFEAITSGIRIGDIRKTANGMGCLGAQLVAHFKTAVGDFYLYPVTSKYCGHEYEYHIYSDRITVKDDTGRDIFTGPWSAFTEFCNKEETV